MTDTTEDISVFVIDRFRIKVAELQNEAVKNSSMQAVGLLERFLGGTPATFCDFNEDILGEWVSWLFCRGYSCATVQTYVSRLSALYGKLLKDGIASDKECFPNIREKLNNVSKRCGNVQSDPDCFKKLRRLVQADCSNSKVRQLARDIVLFSLYNGGLSFEQLYKYKKEDYRGDEKAVLEIVERYSKPKNKYLFPLNQSRRTPRQLSAALSVLYADALKMVGINPESLTSEVPIDLWASAAMRSGLSASDIGGCLEDSTLINPIFYFARKSELSDERKAQLRSFVTRMLTKDPDYWFAMQFRPRVDLDMIKERMKDAGIHFISYYYPMEEIVRQVGKKIKRVARPVVPGLLFFKSKMTGLQELYAHIGDLAWGYRNSRDLRSQYAIIPQSSITSYQMAVGQFIDSIDAYPEGNLRYESGDKVQIISGDFSGQPAIFEKEIRELTKDGKTVVRIISRLKLMAAENFTWTVDLDPRQMVKISDDKFENLLDQIRS